VTSFAFFFILAENKLLEIEREMPGHDEAFSPVLSGRHEVRAKNE
jgi:hypothetical protein